MIESIKICDDLNNESQYLCLQLNCLNQIKCHKNNFLYLKLILLLSGDISLNPRTIQNNRLKENWKKCRNRNLHFIHLNINSLLPKIDELREIVKNIKLSGYWHYRNEIRSFDWWFRNSLDASTDTVPFDVIETERVDV